jgi:hypothetical protein
MSESVPGQNMTGRAYSPATSQPRATSRETDIDGNNSNDPSTDQYNKPPRLEDLEARSQTTSEGYGSENHSKQHSNEAMDLSHDSHNARHLDPQRANNPYSVGLESQIDHTLKENTKTSINTAYLAGQNIENWPSINSLFDNTGDALRGFDDIFQLVDMPHILNDQFSQTQSRVFDGYEYRFN